MRKTREKKKNDVDERVEKKNVAKFKELIKYFSPRFRLRCLSQVRIKKTNETLEIGPSSRTAPLFT